MPHFRRLRRVFTCVRDRLRRRQDSTREVTNAVYPAAEEGTAVPAAAVSAVLVSAASPVSVHPSLPSSLSPLLSSRDLSHFFAPANNTTNQHTAGPAVPSEVIDREPAPSIPSVSATSEALPAIPLEDQLPSHRRIQGSGWAGEDNDADNGQPGPSNWREQQEGPRVPSNPPSPDPDAAVWESIFGAQREPLEEEDVWRVEVTERTTEWWEWLPHQAQPQPRWAIAIEVEMTPVQEAPHQGPTWEWEEWMEPDFLVVDVDEEDEDVDAPERYEIRRRNTL